jgi:hypothetical protein
MREWRGMAEPKECDPSLSSSSLLPPTLPPSTHTHTYLQATTKGNSFVNAERYVRWIDPVANNKEVNTTHSFARIQHSKQERKTSLNAQHSSLVERKIYLSNLSLLPPLSSLTPCLPTFCFATARRKKNEHFLIKSHTEERQKKRKRGRVWGSDIFVII